MSHSQPTSPPPPRKRRWRLLRAVFSLLGLGLLAYLIRQTGVGTLLEHARRLGWTFLFLVALYGGLNFLRAVSWKLCLGKDSSKLPLSTAVNLWLAGEAVSHFAFGWTGEAFRAMAARPYLPLAKGLSSLLVARMAYFYASLVVMAMSVALAFFVLPATGPLTTFLIGSAVVLGFLLLLPFGGAQLLNREFRTLHEKLERRDPRSLLGRLHRFYHTLAADLQVAFVQNRRTFARLLGINLVASLAGVLEIYLVLRILAPNITLSEAFVIEGGTKVLGIFSMVVPGNVGTREAGVVLILQQLGMAAPVGLALALVRRARAVVWVLIGCVPLFTQGLDTVTRSTPPPDPNDARQETLRSLP